MNANTPASAASPVAIDVRAMILNNIPASMRNVSRWVYSVLIDNSKVPHQANGAKAMINEPSTWSAFESVAALGVGPAFAFTPDSGLVVFDLDDCVSNGVIHPEA